MMILQLKTPLHFICFVIFANININIICVIFDIMIEMITDTLIIFKI